MITIYWGVNTVMFPEGIRAEAPISILQKMPKERIPKDADSGQRYDRCPSFIDELTNLYGIKPYIDFKLGIGENGVSSPNYDQEFYDRHVHIRSLPGNLLELKLQYVFFTEEPSLEMSLLPAYLEDNNVINSTIMIPGKIDIGKYFRGLAFAFHMKQKCNKVSFSRKEISFYVRFHTKEKLRFKQFIFTPEIDRLDVLMMQAKNFKYDLMKLNYYYNIFERFNFKKKILKNIKENLGKEVDK